MKMDKMKNIVYNCDCMEYMKDIPDNAFDLAIIDTDYGIGQDWLKDSKGRGERRKIAFNTTYKNDNPPDEKYFNELFRISRNQIIWGWNYFSNLLPPTNHIIIWDKMRNVKKTFRSECEQAWTSIKIPQRIYHIRWDGCKKGKETGIQIIHPHQKPILLYKKLLSDYGFPGQIIFDSHVGSGSIRIACHDMGFDFVGCEKDPDYWKVQENRFKDHLAKGKEIFEVDEYQQLIFKD